MTEKVRRVLQNTIAARSLRQATQFESKHMYIFTIHNAPWEIGVYLSLHVQTLKLEINY